MFDPGRLFSGCTFACCYVFIYLWPCWVFIAAHGLSLGVANGSDSPVAMRKLRISVVLVVEHRIEVLGLQ